MSYSEEQISLIAIICFQNLSESIYPLKDKNRDKQKREPCNRDCTGLYPGEKRPQDSTE